MQFTWGPQAIRSESQVRSRQALVRAKIGTVFDGSSVKTFKRLFETLTGALVPEVPSLSDEIIRFWDVEAVSEFRTMRNPGTEFPQGLLEFRHGDIHGVTGNDSAIPCLANHVLVIDILAAVLNERF